MISRRWFPQFEEAGHDASRIAPLLKSAAAWSARLQSEQDEALSALIERVDLNHDGMRLALRLSLSNADSGAHASSSHLSLKRCVPMQIGRRGVELRLVINCGATCKTDQSLLRAVARAHCWFDDLASGRRGSMVKIAKRDGVGKQYVSRLMRLAFLAPEIVERIVAGRQPPELTAQALRTGRFDIPVDWAVQRRVLAFCAGGLSTPLPNSRPAAIFLLFKIAAASSAVRKWKSGLYP